jgi:phosphomannomutase
MTLRVASFGIRGKVGDSLTIRTAMDFSSAFATFSGGGRILLGRDTRYSSPMYHAAVLSSLLSAGCEVLDFGVCPTPILQFCVQRYDAAGAVSITGGHTAAGWNAITLIGADGSFLEPLGGEAVLDGFHAGDFLRRPWDQVGVVRVVDDFLGPYLDAIEKEVEVEAIRRADFTVLADPVGGAGCAYLEPFARRMGIKLVPINAQPSGYLAREPEPRPRSAQQMASIIGRIKGDIGFVFSSDMGRMSLVTEAGEPASEEYTFAIIASHVLSRRPGPVVTNCCTTRTIDDVAALRKVPLIKTKVGQAYVLSALMDEQGVIGGEGSGSIVLPSFSRGFDGFLMMALVLDAMAGNQCPLSDLLRALPRYHIVKKKILCESSAGYRAIDSMVENAQSRQNVRIDMTDGLRVDRADGWVHARLSRTEKAVRVISEAVNRKDAERHADDAIRAIRQAV